MIDAVSSASTLPEVPVATSELFKRLSQSYLEVPALAEVPAKARVRSVLLGDSNGVVLVLVAGNQLLDLRRLAEIKFRELTALSQETGQAWLRKRNMVSLAGLPPLLDCPCVYDERLLEQPLVYLDSGHPDILLEVSRETFRVLLRNAASASLGQPVDDFQPNLTRPGDDTQEITRAVESLTSRRIRKRLDETLEIPPLAPTAQRIVKLRVDPNASVEDITNLVETDPALAAQVMSWASSPYYAPNGKVRSVEDAIVRVLGFDRVINLALGLALGKSLAQPKDAPQDTTPYWRQAIYIATVVEGLARCMPRHLRPEPGLAYLGGLLHNFGYLVLAQVFLPHFTLICRHLESNPHLPHDWVEQYWLGITREQIGASLLRTWGMPGELVTALRFQNDPTYDGEHSAYANLICVAVRLLRERGIGDGPQLEVPDELLERLELPRERADSAINQVLAAEAALRELAQQFDR